jgi:hypothetical protein
MTSSSFGFGQAIAAARYAGALRIVLALGCGASTETPDRACLHSPVLSLSDKGGAPSSGSCELGG